MINNERTILKTSTKNLTSSYYIERGVLMRFISRLFLGAFIFLVSTTFKTWSHETVIPLPPPTRSKIVIETLHGIPIRDPYRWLEDQKSPETRKWIESQNNYTKSLIETLPWREQLKQRVTAFMRIDAISTPIARNNRYFFSKRLAYQEQNILYVKKGLTESDELLIDPNPLSQDHTTSVTLLGISKDGTLMAYGIRRGGEDELIIHLHDLDTRKDLPDKFPKYKYWNLEISPDKHNIYYTIYSKDGPRLYSHLTGTDSSKDQEIFGKGIGPEKGLGFNLSDDGRYLLVNVSHGWGRNDLYVVNPVNKNKHIIIKGVDAGFDGKFAGDHLFVSTNWKAPKGQIFDVTIYRQPASSVPAKNWKLVVPETDAVIEEFSPAGGKLLVHYIKNAASSLKLFNLDGTLSKTISFPALGSVVNINSRWEDQEIFFSFVSFQIPSIIYRYDLETEKQEIWAKVNVPFHSNDIEVSQIWYNSKDGVKIPMFLVHRKGIKLDGSNPVLLTGYGGFNQNMTPWFSPKAALWVEHGGVFALPNLRGGGEFGETWHRAGMLEKKQTVFDDFISAAEWLIANGYTQPSKLAISGGSNGGLLVGAALTQKPELFGAVVCAYPLLDMIRYHKFLVAKLWVPEYGSAENPKQFKYIYAYSPYHHVKLGVPYPAALFITGDSDTRVDPLHARKMAARLQTATSSGEPVLLHYDTKAGHSGGLPVSKRIEDMTDELAFLFWQLGVPFNYNR